MNTHLYTRYILDTNVISELAHPCPDRHVVDWLNSFAYTTHLFITAITVSELMQGLLLMPHGKRRQEVQRFVEETLRQFSDRTLGFDAQAGLAAASTLVKRQRTGQPTGIADTYIAGIAEANGCAIATRSTKDFADLGIPLENPWDWGE